MLVIAHRKVDISEADVVLYLNSYKRLFLPSLTPGCFALVGIRCSSHWFSRHVWLLFNCNHHQTMRSSTYSLTAHW